MTLNKVTGLVQLIMASPEFSKDKLVKLQTVQELLKDGRQVGSYIPPRSDCRRSEVLLSQCVVTLLPQDEEAA